MEKKNNINHANLGKWKRILNDSFKHSNQRNVRGLAKSAKQREPGWSKTDRSMAEGSWHCVRKGTHFHVVLCVLGFGDTRQCLVQLCVVLWPLETLVSLETTTCRAVVLGLETAVGSSVLDKLSMERLNPWLDRYISLSWKAEPRRIKDWPISSIVENISSAWLGFRAHRASTSKY